MMFLFGIFCSVQLFMELVRNTKDVYVMQHRDIVIFTNIFPLSYLSFTNS